MVVLYAFVVALAAVLGVLAYGWLEAGNVRLRELRVPVPGLPPGLDGLRIAHLSDFHLGARSYGRHAVMRAVAWAEAENPDLTLVTGDLLSHPRGERLLHQLVARLPSCYAVLGNHDIDAARDPFSKAPTLDGLRGATLLNDEGWVLRLRGCGLQIAGVHPASYLNGADSRITSLAAPRSDLRILLCHFPNIVDRLEPGAWSLVLAGHMHDGQICVPYPGGKLRLAHPHARYTHGLYRRPGGILHVSPGLGTTFVPFRFFARPEATMLILESPDLQQRPAEGAT